MKRIINITIVSLLGLFIITGCRTGDQEGELSTLSGEEIDSIRTAVSNAPRQPVAENEVGVIETNYGTIVVDLFEELAPGHTENFKRLANLDYYEGTWFHRVIKGFVIQGGDILSRDGDPSNDGTGGPGYTIDEEFSKTPHYRGRLSMARGQNPNSAGSQFYIVQNPELTRQQIYNAENRVGYEFPDSVVQEYLDRGGAPFLDNQYTVFGEVIKGMDVVDEIADIPTDNNDRPTEKVIMTEVYVTDRNKLNL